MDLTLLIIILGSIIGVVLKTYRPALYLTVGWFVEAMVRAAEQEYKESKGKVNRRALAKEQIRTVLKWIGVNPDKWNAQIDWLMNAAITRLPKTPKFDTEDPAISGVGVVDKSI